MSDYISLLDGMISLTCAMLVIMYSCITQFKHNIRECAVDQKPWACGWPRIC